MSALGNGLLPGRSIDPFGGCGYVSPGSAWVVPAASPNPNSVKPADTTAAASVARLPRGFGGTVVPLAGSGLTMVFMALPLL
jgi:hypothetical protein